MSVSRAESALARSRTSVVFRQFADPLIPRRAAFS
jgi:hypothetical protein